MIEQILTARNLSIARNKVIANKGSSGVDDMKVSDLKDYIQSHRLKVRTSIIHRSYKVSPIRGVEIPKGNGKTRLLGVPTVVERWLQQAVS